MGVIPFYGTSSPRLFAIERRAMDRPGLVIDRLDALLPKGRVLDIGAGDGFTAETLNTNGRSVVALEPAPQMWRTDRPITWTGGEAERLPFGDSVFEAAYATWAYFFTRDWDPSVGIAEASRVVQPGGRLIFVDNLGGDEFTAYAPGYQSADPNYWAVRGFELEIIETTFEFENQDEANELMTLYFGARDVLYPTRLSYRVGLFIGRV